MAGTPIGRILLMPKGDYSSSAIYDHLDVVRHAGASWVCTQDSTTGIAPAAGVAEWQLMVADGSIGGWASLASKPFETIGDGLDVNASDELFVDIGDTLELDAITNKIEVKVNNLYVPSSTGSELPISGQGVADAIDQTYDGTSAKAQSGVAIESELGDRLDEYTALALPVSNVVTFSNLNPDYGYEISVDIPDEPSGSLPTTLSNVFVPKCTNIQRSTNADGTINLAYTVTDTNMQYALRILK